MIDLAIYALVGVSGAVAGLVLADSAVKLINARRRIREQLKGIRNV